MCKTIISGVRAIIWSSEYEPEIGIHRPQAGKDNLKGRAGINMIFYSKVLIFTLSSLGRLWDCIYRLEGEDAGGVGRYLVILKPYKNDTSRLDQPFI